MQASQADPNCSLFKVWLACRKTVHRFAQAISSTVTRSWAVIPAGSLLVPRRKSRLAKTSKLQEVVKLKRSRTAWRHGSWTSAGIPRWQSRYIHLGPAEWWKQSEKFRGWKFAGFRMFQLIKTSRAGWRLSWFQYFATISQFPRWHTADAASAACFFCFLCELLHVCDVSDFPQSTRKGSQVRQLIHNANCCG